MSKSIENWLAANAPGDVRAFVNANQLRLSGQAETIAELRDALRHLAYRTHPFSEGCSTCMAIQKLLEWK